MSSPTSPPPASGKPRNWWQRNWTWFVPVGCLSAMAMLLGFIVLVFLIVFGAIRSSEVHHQALARAQEDAAVAQALGSPIQTGFWVGGNISVSGPSGTADLAIPLSGPKGQGTLYAEAKKAAGSWEFSTLVLEVQPTGERIDLLAPVAVEEPQDAGPAQHVQELTREEVEEPERPVQDAGPSLSYREVQFAKRGPDGEFIQVPNTFKAGEEFSLVFTMVGPFQVDAEGYSEIEVEVVVLDPSRNRVIDKPAALKEEGKLRLPDGFAPTVFATIPTEPGMEPGTYTLSVVIRDRQAGRRTVRNTIFTLQ